MYKMIFTTYNMIKGIDVYNKIIRMNRYVFRKKQKVKGP